MQTGSQLSQSTLSTSSSQSNIASPASTPATTTASPTGSPVSQESRPAEKKDNTAAIAAGVTVPVVVIALGLVGFLLYTNRQKRGASEVSELPGNQASEAAGATIYHEKESYRHVELDAAHAVELESGARGELDTTSAEATVDTKIPRLLTGGTRQ